MWNCVNIKHLKWSLLGTAMLLTTGCSSLSKLPLTTSQTLTPEPKQPPPPNAKADVPKHTTMLSSQAKSASIPVLIPPNKPKAIKEQPTTALEKVAWCARKQQGKLYCWGGSSPTTGFDCSGLTQYSFRQGAGVHLPRTAAAQYAAATKISQQQAQRGDLVFFRTRGNGVSHVGIYLGDKRFIHAPRTGKAITVSQLSDYWQKRLVGFGRIPGACRPVYS